MSFLHPAAFYGLASILALILLSLWRMRPAKVVVPSVRLWERIPDRLPPVRALRRPRASLSLFLQMLVAAALVFAMAGPGVTALKPAPRRITVVLDNSAYMVPRMDDIGVELEKLDSSDDVTIIECLSLERRRRDQGYFISSEQIADPRPALDLAASEAKDIVFISDRSPAWAPPAGVQLHLALVGGPERNVGIVDAGFDGDKLFVRLSEPAPLTVVFDGSSAQRSAAGFHLVKVPSGSKQGSAFLEPDVFSGDNAISFDWDSGQVDVGFVGRPDAAILAAIEANPRARVVRGGSPRLLIRVASSAPKGQASVVVDVDPVEGVKLWREPAGVVTGDHPITRGLPSDELRFDQVGILEGPADAVLISMGKGDPIAILRRPGEIVLAVRYASTGWPAFPSFPIFWSNVLDYTASEAGGVKGLLDEAASRPGLERKPLDPAALGPRPLAPVRTDLAGGAIAAAAVLLGLLWFVESRGKE